MAAVNCVLAKEIATYVKLSKHSVIDNSINEDTVRDSLLLFLGCTPIDSCIHYVDDCNGTAQIKCSIVVRLDTTTAICKTPLIQLI